MTPSTSRPRHGIATSTPRNVDPLAPPAGPTEAGPGHVDSGEAVDVHGCPLTDAMTYGLTGSP